MDPKQAATIGAQVRQARKQRGMTVQELADAAGVAKNTVTGVELGRNTRPGNLRAVLDALGIEPLVAQIKDGYPDDIQLILDVIGQWLRGKDEAARTRSIRALMMFVATDGNDPA
jgi:transcriptional regulator with XRE-family HTH domain